VELAGEGCGFSVEDFDHGSWTRWLAIQTGGVAGLHFQGAKHSTLCVIAVGLCQQVLQVLQGIREDGARDAANKPRESQKNLNPSTIASGLALERDHCRKRDSSAGEVA
jgi:hypothetical protein